MFFFPQENTLAETFPGRRASLLHLQAVRYVWQRAPIWRPRKLTASFQRKSDKANTLRHKHKEIFFVIPSLWARRASRLPFEQHLTKRARARRMDIDDFDVEFGTIGWKSLRCPALPPACRAAFAPWGPVRTKYFLRSSMSAVSRGGDAGARSHAESLSGVSGHTSRSLSSLREKIVAWQFVQKTYVTNEPAW